MARGSKWSFEASPDQPLSRVVRAALQERLDVVRKCLRRAARGTRDNVEQVHQLRVSTRRAAATLRVFRQLLPERRTRIIKKVLRRIRNTAGDVRDLDVLIDRLRKEQSSLRPIAKIRKHALARRDKAHELLAGLRKQLRMEHTRRSFNALVARTKWRDTGQEPTFRDAARQALREAVDEFFQAANADLSNIEALHRLRIRGKHLRYTIELLAAAFDPALTNKLYPKFVDVQSRLGAINDHATAERMYGRWARDFVGKQRDALRELQRTEEKQIESTCKHFRKWWTLRRRTALEAQFQAMLADPQDQIKATAKSKPRPTQRAATKPPKTRTAKRTRAFSQSDNKLSKRRAARARTKPRK